MVLDYQNSDLQKFKSDLTEALVAELFPISEMLLELKDSRDFIEDVLADGQSRAFDEAENNLIKIKKAMGMAI